MIPQAGARTVTEAWHGLSFSSSFSHLCVGQRCPTMLQPSNPAVPPKPPLQKLPILGWWFTVQVHTVCVLLLQTLGRVSAHRRPVTKAATLLTGCRSNAFSATPHGNLSSCRMQPYAVVNTSLVWVRGSSPLAWPRWKKLKQNRNFLSSSIQHFTCSQ